MAGISVPQYTILKINSTKLRNAKWDLFITKEEADSLLETVALFEGQDFRLIADILGKDVKNVNFFNYMMILIIDNIKDFRRATKHDGININGHNFRRFVGTSSGLKNNSLIFVNSEVIDELNRRCECDRKEIKILPAKLETYKALTHSASQPICDPNGILVVHDCITHIMSDVISIDDAPGDSLEPIVKEVRGQAIENNTSDGFNLCTIGYMQRISESLGLDYVPSGVCLRNAWLKGMLYPFPIVEFCEKHNGGNYIVQDIWGHDRDIRNIELILTESSLKLWEAYDSIESYINAYHKNGYCFAVTKIAPHELEDQRELNYQYLQSYEFEDEDIKELCAPTVKYLKDAHGADYQSALKFLGIAGGAERSTWQRALYSSEYMLHDPYVIDQIHRMIKNKIDEAKIGKLIVHGNYQIASGDPFALMQSICNKPITGLLRAGQIYSDYWSKEDVNEVVVFRSPMTSHNNICKCEVVNNEQTAYWYQYMSNIMILNGFDTMCQSLNGCDYDGDLLFSSNDPTLVRKHRKTLPIVCEQHKTEKKIPTEEDILASNWNGMGNKVGTITNKITAMMETQSHFPRGSDEWLELQRRIECGQKHQQDEIDRIKGIIAKPMPPYWYNASAAKKIDDYQLSICTSKKPYFMIYVYDDYRRDYKKYIEECNSSAIEKFCKTYQDILEEPNPSEEETKFIEFIQKRNPFGVGLCAMNRICYYIENEFNGLVSKLKKTSSFDYKVFKYDIGVNEESLEDLWQLSLEYKKRIETFKKRNKYNVTKEELNNQRKHMRRDFKERAKNICPDDKQRFNLILDICYKYDGYKQFCWDCIGDEIVKRLEELNL